MGKRVRVQRVDRVIVNSSYKKVIDTLVKLYELDELVVKGYYKTCNNNLVDTRRMIEFKLSMDNINNVDKTLVNKQKKSFEEFFKDEMSILECSRTF